MNCRWPDCGNTPKENCEGKCIMTDSGQRLLDYMINVYKMKRPKAIKWLDENCPGWWHWEGKSYERD